MVKLLMTLISSIGTLLPALRTWISDKSKQDQTDVDFIVKNYRQLDQDSILKITKLEARVSDLEEKFLACREQGMILQAENHELKEKLNAYEHHVVHPEFDVPPKN